MKVLQKKNVTRPIECNFFFYLIHLENIKELELEVHHIYNNNKQDLLYTVCLRKQKKIIIKIALTFACSKCI